MPNKLTLLDYVREYKSGTRKMSAIPLGIQKRVMEITKDPEVDLSVTSSGLKKTDRYTQAHIRSYQS